MGRIERKLLAHMIKAKPPLAVEEWVRLGKDLEEFNTELNPQSEEKENILGEISFDVSGYRPQSSVEPYYAEAGTKLYDYLDDLAQNRRVHDALNTEVLEVHLWETVAEKVFVAYKETAVIELQSYGGDTTGVQIPFNFHYLNDRIKGTYNASTKTFTADSGVLSALIIELAAGNDSAHTKVTDVIGEGSGTLKYRVGASVPQPVYGDSVAEYADLSVNTDIACIDGDVLRVVEAVDGKIIATSGAYKVVIGE